MTQRAVTSAAVIGKDLPMRPQSIQTLRVRALAFALGTVGLTALAALVFPGETRHLAPFALALPFATLGMLEALAGSERPRKA